MPVTATAGQIIVNAALPEDLRNYDRTLAGKEMAEVLTSVATKYPDQYERVSKSLMQIGGDASWREDVSLSVDNFEPPVDRAALFAEVRAKRRAILNDSSLSSIEKNNKLGELFLDANARITDTTYNEALRRKNPLAFQILSKARGNKTQLAAALSSPGFFSDHAGKIVPVYVEHSVSEGLTPAEYFAASYGARASVASTKMGTRRAGDLGKQMSLTTMDLLVTEKDCGTSGGLPVPAADVDNTGALLAADAAGFGRNTPLTAKALTDITDNGVDEILVRSPLTCKARRGICAACAGVREYGRLPNIGENVGVVASSALAERVAQGSLNMKHQAGAKGTGTAAYSGLDYVEQFLQVPATFKNKAPLAELDGLVSSIEKAPQGGSYVIVAGEKHYVPEGQEILVEPGATVETGQALSSGLVSPADAVRLRGIGQGRQYFAERLTQMYRDTGLGVNRRNVEVVGRGIIDNVEVDDATGDLLPGDITSYSDFEYNFKPRDNSRRVATRLAVGKYLETPTLHYSIGTRIVPSVAEKLQKHGVRDILINDEPPNASPIMFRLRAVPHNDTDWLAKMQGTYLQDNLVESVHKGETSNIHSTHPTPALAYGLEFGRSKPGEVTY